MLNKDEILHETVTIACDQQRSRITSLTALEVQREKNESSFPFFNLVPE